MGLAVNCINDFVIQSKSTKVGYIKWDIDWIVNIIFCFSLTSS